MIKKKPLALALSAAASVTIVGAAYADSATELDAFVDGSVKPAKLDKKKYKPVTLLSGVRTSAPGGLNGLQANPRTEVLDYGKNVKFDLSATPACSSLPPNGATPEQARAACPKSYLGSGHGQVIGPDLVTGPGLTIDDLTVSVFHGGLFGKHGLVLYISSPTLLGGAGPVYGEIERSKAGSKFGQALVVPYVPETGAFLVTEITFTIERASKSVLARCMAKKFSFQRTVTFSDGSSDVATLSQPCKRR